MYLASQDKCIHTLRATSCELQDQRGISFIDIVVGIALLSLVFWGIVGTFLLAINLITNAKAKAGALPLAIEQIEMLRSLSYDDVGTEGGIPAGNVAQLEVVTLNGTEYTRRTFIQFVDAPEDGVGGADDNGITADYKHVKVEITWDTKNGMRSLELVSNIVPRGIETLEGGGTLIINVINALGLPVAGASVQVQNEETDPAIDVETFSNEDGQVIFPGSPEANSYQITVTNEGYSSAQTYGVDATNVAPSPAHLSILEGQVSEITFAIDFVAEKTVETYEWFANNSHFDTFGSGALLSVLDQTEVLGEQVVLTRNGTGDYYAIGTVTSITINPPQLGAWQSVTWVDTTPAPTEILYQVLHEQSPGVWTLIPDTDLPGNSTGFSLSPIDVSILSVETYPELRLKATLTTSDGETTPAIDEWELFYQETVLLPNVVFAMQGTKTIGADEDTNPIFKYDETHTTDGSGALVLEDLEWDTYTLTIDGATTGYDIKDSCALAQPRSIDPGVATSTTLYLVPHTTHALHVVVIETDGTPIEGATANLTRSGFDETEITSSCGQALFSGLINDTYDLDVSAPGFMGALNIGVSVSGYSEAEVILSPL